MNSTIENHNNIDYIKNLLNQSVIQQIIFESKLSNHINIHQYKQSQIDEYFINSINTIKTKPQLLSRFIEESTNCVETKYHKENLITHLYCVGWICVLFSTKFNLEPEFAFKLGFFHDIGKPWAKKCIQTKKKVISNYKGHAQIGENICWELGLDKKICWSVSNHMCSCCHENNTLEHWEYNAALQLIGLYSDDTIDNTDKIKKILEYGNVLACLMIGDDLGRLGETESNYSDIITHSDNWFDWFKNFIKTNTNPIKYSVKTLCNLHPDNSIIIQLYGHSGFGKSTTAKNIMTKLDENGIKYEYAKRDESYYNIYAQVNQIEYEQIEHDYKTIYEFIQTNNLKQQVQLDWINQLNQILESDSKVKIIDSVQLMYQDAWESTLSSLDSDAYSVWKSSLKLGYYGFPQSLYGREFVPKTNKHELIPRNINDVFEWSNMNSELDYTQTFDPNFIDIAYGGIEFLINTICNYSKWSNLIIPKKQIHLIEILNNIEKTKLTSKYIQKYVSAQFSPGIIQSNEEYSYGFSHLIRFTYKDGMQVFNGLSRDYRGETILFDDLELKYYIGRISLPVLPDYINLRKDPCVQNIITNGTCSEFNIIPKFDGSLFVLSLVKINTPQYEIINKLLHLVPKKSYYQNELGIWCFGSKGCMFAKDQNQDSNIGVLSRIINSITASYQSIDDFILKITDEIKLNMYNDLYENISLCFEAIDSNPTDELTVDYKKAFCPFLCWIVWDGINKKIILPHNQIYLNPVASINTVDTWDKVIEFKNNAHERLLEGSELDEPEGYVVWFGNTNLGIKLKHPEYYIAHKPYSKYNKEMSKKIEFDPEYSKLKTRLLKFKPKPPIDVLIGENLELLHNLFLNNNEYLDSKKSWALRWKEPDLLKKLNDILQLIENDIVVHYYQFKNSISNKGFTIAIDYFANKENWKNYFLQYFLSKCCKK